MFLCLSERRGVRRGFTLIELLVVITIIAVLAGLLLPAVQSVRGAAARMQCGNNMKQLGLAVLNFETSRGHLPPSEFKPIKDGAEHGWGSMILPFIEQQPLADRYRQDVSWSDPLNREVVMTPLTVWQCPSISANRIDEFSEIDDKGKDKSYKAAAGDYGAVRGVHKDVANYGYIDVMDESNYVGVLSKVDDKDPTLPRVAHVRDGMSMSLMIGESVGRPAFYQLHRKITKTDKKGKQKWNKGGPWAAKENGFEIRGSLYDGTLNDESIKSGPCSLNCTNDKNIFTFHAGGANVVFGDGSVRFVNEQVSIRALSAVITRAAAEDIDLRDF